MPIFYGTSKEMPVEEFALVQTPESGEVGSFFGVDQLEVLYEGKRDCLGDNFVVGGQIAFLRHITEDTINLSLVFNKGLLEKWMKECDES